MTNDRGSAQEGKADYDGDLYGASATGYVTSIPMDDEEKPGMHCSRNDRPSAGVVREVLHAHGRVHFVSRASFFPTMFLRSKLASYTAPKAVMDEVPVSEDGDQVRATAGWSLVFWALGSLGNAFVLGVVVTLGGVAPVTMPGQRGVGGRQFRSLAHWSRRQRLHPAIYSCTRNSTAQTSPAPIL